MVNTEALVNALKSKFAKKTDLNSKQDTLVGSGTGQNIKTVNGNNILGAGDIVVESVEYTAGDNITIEDTTIAVSSDFSSKVTTIEGKIPSEASSTNKLADKSFVSTEISTHNSATDAHSTLFSNKTIALTESTGTGDIAKIYTITQGSSEVGKINIPRDLVVKEGSIVEEEGVKYLKLVLTNDSIVKINVADLCDVYKADGVTLTLSDDNTFSIKEGYLSTVATTGSYNDLSNTPSVYTKTETDGLLDDKVDKVDGKGLSSNDYDDTSKAKLDSITVDNLELISNKVTSFSSTPSDTNYPSEKLVVDSLQGLVDDLAEEINKI